MTAPAAAAVEAQPAPNARLARWAIYASALAVAAPIRLWAAVSDQGMFWPDEIYQSVEQAHRLAFGTGIIPWEFVQGARSWLFPGLLAGLLKLAHLFGARDALTYVVVCKIAVVLIGLVGIWAAMRLAERYSGLAGAVLAGALCASFPAMVVYAARCMTETASGPLIVGAALAALSPGAKWARLSGVLAGVAVFLRYQNGLVTAGLLLILLVQRRKQDALQYAIAASVVGLLGGALDWITWGQPFHSFILYVKFNLIEGKASNWGTSPFGYYLSTAWTSTGPALLLIPIGLAACWKHARGYVLLVVAYLLAHSLVPHKEYRFLVPILLLTLALAGAGLGELANRFKLPAAVAPVVAAALVAVGYRTALAENFHVMGQYDGALGEESVWHANEDVNRVVLYAGRQADLCGMIVAGIQPAWVGAYTYLNRDVPFFFHAGSAEAQSANYLAIPYNGRLPPPWSPVLRDGHFTLYHRDGPCAPPPASWKPLLP